MRPILRLATRLTSRTRWTARAIGFACAVLVGSLVLVGGLSGGIDALLVRVDTGPFAYIQGRELLETRIDPSVLPSIPGDFDVLRIHVGVLEINGVQLEVVVAALESHRSGTPTAEFPLGLDDVSLDTGLRAEIERLSGSAPAGQGDLTLFGTTLIGLPIVDPPPSRMGFAPTTWAYVRPELLYSVDLTEGGSVQAILTPAPLGSALLVELGLEPLDLLGAAGFMKGGVEEAAQALRLLALVIAVLIGLLVYSAMSLEVHARTAEIRTLRSLGASPASVAGIYEAQALTLGVLGAVVGSALGIVLAYAAVSFAPLVGLPNLVIPSPPLDAVVVTAGIALLAAALGGIVPSRHAALVVRGGRGVGGS